MLLTMIAMHRTQAMSKHLMSRFHSTRPSRDFLTNIRLQIAKSLTETLSPEIQKEFLGAFQDTPSAHPATPATPPPSRQSIAEAVAAARQEEAIKSEERWKEEREAIIREAEEAARARVLNDIVVQKRQLAFQQWKEEVDKDNKNSAPESEDGGEKELQQTEQTDADHPILGQCLSDLGYKRIYLAPASSLVNIPIWEKQRVYRHDRAKLMATDKLKSVELGLPGVITIHEESTTGKLSILDGQHRIGMLSLLAKKPEAASFLDRVLVEVYSSNDGGFSKDLFVEINKAEPVKLVDMPGIAKSSDRATLSDAASSLRDKFPEMFKPSQRCRPPHLNEDNLRDALFAAKVLERHNIKSSKALIDWMLKENDALAKLYISDQKAQSKVAKTALSKATKNNFFLGLDSSWYNN